MKSEGYSENRTDAVGARTSGQGDNLRQRKQATWQLRVLGLELLPTCAAPEKRTPFPCHWFTKQRETSSCQPTCSMMLSALPAIWNPDFQLMNTEQIPQCLCLTVLNSWIYLWDTTSGFGCYVLFLTWLLVHIFQCSEDLLEKPLCYFLG